MKRNKKVGNYSKKRIEKKFQLESQKKEDRTYRIKKTTKNK